MSNKHRLITANTKFDQQLIKMINELEEQKSPEGQYVWKKYSGSFEQFTITNPAITFTPDGQDTSGNYKFKVTETNGNSIDFDYITNTFFDGFVMTVSTQYATWKLTYTDGTLKYGQVGDSTSYVCWYDAETHHLICATKLWAIVHYATYTGDKTYTKDTRVFVDYVVSDDESAYPDGAEQDGYWYERYEGVDLSALGVSKIAIDTFTFSTEKQAKNTSVTHSLREIPKLAYVQATNITKANYERIIRMIVITPSFGEGHGGTIEIGATEFLDSSNSHGASYSTFHATPTAQNLVFYGGNGFYQAGKEYTLITMA